MLAPLRWLLARKKKQRTAADVTKTVHRGHGVLLAINK